VNLQAQLHQQELRHNQELAIALRGINRNTRQIGAVAQQLANPLNHPQQPENSNGSVGSRLPSTFHSTANNEHPSAPPAPVLVPVWPNPVEGIHHPEVNLVAHQADPQEDPSFFKIISQVFNEMQFFVNFAHVCSHFHMAK
jgi:hypothetical protein